MEWHNQRGQGGFSSPLANSSKIFNQKYERFERVLDFVCE